MTHNIDPIFITLGSFNIYWYGVMYLIAFLLAWYLGNIYIKKNIVSISRDQFSDLIFYSFLGVFFGGRIGYCLFYNLAYSIENPISILFIWDGGMSFHGGFIGVLISTYYFCQKNSKNFFQISDLITALTPIGLFTGRVGNFINGELWGKPTEILWGVIFPRVDMSPRHPTQIYEAILEGLILFIILNILYIKKLSFSIVTAYFLIFYSFFRFFIEFFRVPDLHIGYVAFNWVTMGQLLCLPMFFLGIYFLQTNKGNYK